MAARKKTQAIRKRSASRQDSKSSRPAKPANRQISPRKMRKFEGADAGRRTGGWVTAGTSANAVNQPSLAKLRDRSRDLVRNNPYARRAVDVITANAVGTGIVARPQGGTDARNAKVASLWREWAESTDCDADGVNDFYGIQALAMRCMVEAGEVLIRRRARYKSDGYAVPLQLQILEADFIDTSRNFLLDTGGYIIQGKEFDARGKLVNYWLFSSHPGDSGLVSRGIISKPVPASEIIHLFRVDRAGQIRGIAWGAPVILRLRDLDELEDALLLKQKIAACFSAFVHDMESATDIAEAEATIGDKLEPGAIEHLPPGKEISFPSMPSAADDGHSSRMLHSVAAGFGVTYESLTGDFSNVNYSSARMAWLEFQRNLAGWQNLILVPRLCVPIWRWFREAATLQGVPAMDISARWTTPRREMIDPAKENAATLAAIRAGTTTLSQSILEQGEDPDEVFAQRAADDAKLDAFKIKLDSDPRYLSNVGVSQNVANPGGKDAKTG